MKNIKSCVLLAQAFIMCHAWVQAMDDKPLSLCAKKLWDETASESYKAAAKEITGSTRPMAAHYISGPTPAGMAWVPYGVLTKQGRLHDRLYDYTIMAARGVSSFASISAVHVANNDLHEINVDTGLTETTAYDLCGKLECYFQKVLVPTLRAVADIRTVVDLPTEEELNMYHHQVIISIKKFRRFRTMSVLKEVDEAISLVDALGFSLAPLE